MPPRNRRSRAGRKAWLWRPRQLPRTMFSRRQGTGRRQRLRYWPRSLFTGQGHMVVVPAEAPDKKFVLMVGDSQLQPIVDGAVTMPEGRVSFGFISSGGASAAQLVMEVQSVSLPRSPDAVGLLAPSNNLRSSRSVSEAAADFEKLLQTLFGRCPVVFVLDFPPRLDVEVSRHENLRHEFNQVATRLGVEYFPVAAHFPLDRLELWSREGIYLSDDGMKILVQLLWEAVNQRLEAEDLKEKSIPVNPDVLDQTEKEMPRRTRRRRRCVTAASEASGGPTELPADVQQLLVSREEDPPQQPERSSSLDQDQDQDQDQEDPPELPHIKEEQEEVWTNQEADVSTIMWSVVSVKREDDDDDDDEEKPQTSQLHQRQTEEKTLRFQDLKDLFCQQLLTAARDDLIGRFQTIMCRYEKELDRQQKLLNVVSTPQLKLQRAVIPGDVGQQWSSGLDQEPRHTQERNSLRDVEDLFTQQLLTAAREDLTGLFETTISRCEKELGRQKKLLDVFLKPEIKLRRADVQQLLVSKDKVPPEQQEWRSSLDQEDPPELPHIKEEQEELWINQEADISMFTSTTVPVKSEDVAEEKPQSSQLHQRQTEQMETEAGGEDCGGPEPDRNSDPERHLQPETEDKVEDSSETDVSDGDWEENREPQSGFNCLNNNEVPVSDVGSDLRKKSVISSDGDERSPQNSKLKTDMRTKTGEKLFSCSLCNEQFKQMAHLTSHMVVHTGEKPFSCSESGKRFGQQGIRNRHMKIHTREKLFQCSGCGERFTQQDQLTHHTAIHTGEKPFSCSQCHEKFARKAAQHVGVQSSQLHQRQTERMETEAGGEDCGGPEPARNSDPERHLQPETEDKDEDSSETDVSDGDWEESTEPQSGFNNNEVPVSDVGSDPRKKSVISSDGDERSAQNSKLKTDMRTKTGEKLFSCSLCNKQFKQMAHLTSHMVVHTGEKPFSCSECHERFAQKAAQHVGVRSSQLHQRQTEQTPSSISEDQAELWTADVNKMSRLQDLKDFFKQQLLTATREDLIRHFETTISRYEQEIDRQRKLLDVVLKPEIKLRRADVQQVFVSKEEVLPEQQEWSSNLDQEDPQELPQVKEEQKEQPHQRLTEQMGPEADGEDCGGPEPARNSDPDGHLQPETEDKVEDSSETDVSDGDWEESREPQSGLNCPKNNEVPVSEVKSDPGKKTFISSDGDERSPQNSKLKSDMRTKTGEKLFSCSLCNKQFTRNVHVISHMLVHTGEKPFGCSECGKRFGCQGSLNRHMKIHTGEKRFQCSVCCRQFSQQGTLAYHMAIHTGEKPFICTKCGARFARKANLLVHMLMHTKKKPFHCSECGKRFKRKRYLTLHMARQLKTHQRVGGWSSQLHQRQTKADGEECGGPEPVRNCDPDGHLQPETDDKIEDFSETEVSDGDWEETREPLSDLNVVESGRIPAVNSSKKRFSCSECGKQFTAKHTMKQHMVCHTGEKPFSCHECGKRFSLKKHLVTHMRTHTGEKPFSCTFCDKQFTQKGSLTSHMVVHSGEKPFSCSECGERFGHQANLNRHMKIHTGQKQYHCSVCGKKFIQKAHLTNHVTIHTEEKPFSCPECGKRFGSQGNLNRHMRAHTGEKRFQCSVCGKRFTQQANLTRHEATHPEKKPFICPTYGARFALKAALSDHTAHTGKKQFKCGKRFEHQCYLTLNMDGHKREEPHGCITCENQLHQRQTEQMETEADGEDCGGPEPARESDPDGHLQSESEDKIEDVCASECPAGVQQMLGSKEQVPPEQQEWRSSQDQDPPELPHIKKEQEELWTLEEADIIKFTFTPVTLKSEDDDEEKPQSKTN